MNVIGIFNGAQYNIVATEQEIDHEDLLGYSTGQDVSSYLKHFEEGTISFDHIDQIKENHFDDDVVLFNVTDGYWYKVDFNKNNRVIDLGTYLANIKPGT